MSPQTVSRVLAQVVLVQAAGHTYLTFPAITAQCVKINIKNVVVSNVTKSSSNIVNMPIGHFL